MEMGRHKAAASSYVAAVRVAPDAVMKAEVEARLRGALAAAKAPPDPSKIVNCPTPLPPGADPVFRSTMTAKRVRGTMELPSAYRAGPGGPRAPDTVLAAMDGALSTDAVQLVAIPGKGFGVVARRPLPARTVVHVERPLVAVSVSGGVQCYHCLRPLSRGAGVPCACDRVFCSAECKATAVTHYHGALCGTGGGKADAMLEAAASDAPKSAARGILLPWKMLGLALTAAAAAGTPPVAPLDLPPYCHLHRPNDLVTPAGGSDAGLLRKHIYSAPLAVAWALFYDALGDKASVLMQLPPSWLMEVDSVTGGNAFGLPGGVGVPEGTAVASVGSYFNHSCVSNARWDADATGGASLSFITQRAVAAGEELTISYAGDKDRSMRTARLAFQYGFKCICPECQEEARLEAAGAVDARTARQRASDALNRFDSAAQVVALNEVLAADPRDTEAWELRSLASLLANINEGGLRSYCDAYHLAYHLDPRNGLAWERLGQAQMTLDQRAAAVASFRKAIALHTEPKAKANCVKMIGETESHTCISLTCPPAKYPLQCLRTCMDLPSTLAMPAAFRAGPGGPRQLDTVLASVADTRTTDWVRFAAVPGKGVGVVAARDIPAGTTVHIERPVLSTALPPADSRVCYHCLLPVTAATAVPCACDRLFCSDACKATALQYYHAATCGAGDGTADARLEAIVRTDASFGVRMVLLQWKLLGWALTAAKAAHKRPAPSPLDLPPFCFMDRSTDLDAPPRGRGARGGSGSGGGSGGGGSSGGSGVFVAADAFMYIWELFHDLLGGDADMTLMDPRWLLDAMTVIDTNSVLGAHGGLSVLALTRGAACFNHSCEPNAAFVMDVPATGSLVTVVTSRPVAAGEEVTVSYIPGDVPFAARRSINQVSRGFTCTCPRCLADERTEAARGTLDKDWTAPSRRALPAPPALAGRRSQAQVSTTRLPYPPCITNGLKREQSCHYLDGSGMARMMAAWHERYLPCRIPVRCQHAPAVTATAPRKCGGDVLIVTSGTGEFGCCVSSGVGVCGVTSEMHANFRRLCVGTSGWHHCGCSTNTYHPIDWHRHCHCCPVALTVPY